MQQRSSTRAHGEIQPHRQIWRNGLYGDVPYEGDIVKCGDAALWYRRPTRQNQLYIETIHISVKSRNTVMLLNMSTSSNIAASLNAATSQIYVTQCGSVVPCRHC